MKVVEISNCVLLKTLNMEIQIKIVNMNLLDTKIYF